MFFLKITKDKYEKYLFWYLVEWLELMGECIAQQTLKKTLYLFWRHQLLVVALWYSVIFQDSLLT